MYDEVFFSARGALGDFLDIVERIARKPLTFDEKKILKQKLEEYGTRLIEKETCKLRGENENLARCVESIKRYNATERR